MVEYHCPICGRYVAWIQEHGQYYCHGCATYVQPVVRDDVDRIFGSIEREFRGPASPPCAACGTPLQFVHQYQRWFCPRCNQYK
jgi:DNA-directed RNA polymerase subunit RPC12/RpoP